MNENALLLALMAEVPTTDPIESREFYFTALALSRNLPLAQRWGRVLTEYTAPQPAPYRAPVPDLGRLHAFLDGFRTGRCSAVVEDSDSAGRCDQFPGAPVHRTEELTPAQHNALEYLAHRTEEPVDRRLSVEELAAIGRLEQLHLVYVGDPIVPTPLGRAWLEAHPRGGEPS